MRYLESRFLRYSIQFAREDLYEDLYEGLTVLYP